MRSKLIILILIVFTHFSIQAQTITLSGKNMPLSKVFSAIEKQTGYALFSSKKILASTKPISFSVTNMPLIEFLDMALKNQSLSYKISDKTIILSKKIDNLQATDLKVVSNGELVNVKGRVVNEKGEVVIATIAVNGSDLISQTDNYGAFNLTNIPRDAILTISGINIETFEVKVNGKENLLLSARSKVTNMEEVIVKTNYWTSTKRLSVGNISKVTAKDIERQPVASPLLALQGRVAGLEISLPPNAMPGVAPTIRIRGNNSLRIGGKNVSVGDDGNYPLYVIDGVPVISSPIFSNTGGTSLTMGGYDPLSTINPANIESIEILKDADATAIYGSRGANGVILITTKMNTNGAERTNVDISAYKGVGQVSKKIELLNTQQYLAMRNEAFANEGLTVNNNDVDLKYWDQSRYTDWQKVLLGGAAQINDMQGNISTGNKNTSFRIGAGYHNETLIFSRNFGYTRISGNASINHISTNQRFKVATTINYGNDNNNLFADDQSEIVARALSLPPNAPKLFNEDGSLNWELHFIQGSLLNTWTNPLAARLNKQKVSTRNLISNANISYEVVPGLSLSINMGYTDLSNRENSVFPMAARSPTDDLKAFANFNEVHRDSWIIEPKVSYFKKIKEHSLDVIVGTTWQQTNAGILTIGAGDYASDALLNSLKGAGKVTINNDELTEYKYRSLYGRIGYNWRQKYLVNITGRRDASSRFAPSKRFGNFGSLGLGWIFSEEKFVENAIPFLSFGKLRGSYGSNGSDAVADYQYYNLYNLLGINYNGVPGLIPYSLYNPNFVWETTKKLELGLELAFLDNRLGMEISWYLNRSSNQLVNYSMPYTTGFPSVVSNFNATVQNNGLEVLFRADPVVSKNWRWNTSFNISVPRNKLLRFDDIENSPYYNKYKVGEPLSIQWLFNWTGIDQQTGLYTFADENHDGEISNLDRKLMNPTDQTYYGGWNNTIQYNAFELSVLLQFSKRVAPKYMPEMPGRMYNQSVNVLDRWFAPGDQTDIQRFGIIPPSSGSGYSGDAFVAYQNARLSNYNIQDASFVRIKTLSVSYSLTPRLLQQIKLQQVRFFIQGQNLLTFTPYKGLDPETGSGLPPLRMFTGGIQVRL